LVLKVVRGKRCPCQSYCGIEAVPISEESGALGSSPKPWDGVALMMSIGWHYSQVYPQSFPGDVQYDLREEPAFHWSCQQAVY